MPFLFIYVLDKHEVRQVEKSDDSWSFPESIVVDGKSMPMVGGIGLDLKCKIGLIGIYSAEKDKASIWDKFEAIKEVARFVRLHRIKG